MAWQMGEQLYLTGEAELISIAEQETHKESNAREGLIREFVAKKVPKDWDRWTLNERKMFWSGGFQYDGELVERTKVCAAEIWCECFGKEPSAIKPSDSYGIAAIMKKIDGWERTGRQSLSIYGQQRVYCHKTE